MTVDRFSRGIGKFPGLRVSILGHLVGSEGGEFVACHFVLQVEVGGDHKEPVIAEPAQCALEHVPPQGRIIPVILVAHEGEIEALAIGHGCQETLSVLHVEAGLDVVILRGAPPLAGGFDFSRADVGTHDFKSCGLLAEHLGQYAGLISAPAGEIEDALFRSRFRCARDSGQGGLQGLSQDGHILWQVRVEKRGIGIEGHGGRY